MVIKHSTVHNPNDIVPSADWNANHTGTATPEPHTHTHASTTGQTTDDHHAKQHAITSATDHTSTATTNQMLKADANGLPVDATNTDGEVSATVTASHAKQHALNSAANHTGTITDAQHGVRTTANAHAHSHLSGVTSDQHHAQAHTLASHSSKDHSELTNVTSDQHHAQSHNMASHTDDYSPGEGIDISAGNVISGEDATIANKGIASFNTDHFVVAAGAASLNNTVVNSINANTSHRGADGSDHSLLTSKTSYWSCAGTHFNTAHPDVDDVVYYFGSLRASASIDHLIGEVTLPNGATVTNVIVYGNAGAEDVVWEMRRITTAAGGVGDVMATQNVNTADATITNPIIDRTTYSYILFVDALSAADEIHGAKIIYTTNYD